MSARGKDTKRNIRDTKGKKHISYYLHQQFPANPTSWFQATCINSQPQPYSSSHFSPPTPYITPPSLEKRTYPWPGTAVSGVCKS